MAGTLSERLEQNRTRLFVGRQAEQDAFARLLDAEDPSRLLFFHGPGGIGKTLLTQLLARRAEEKGFAVFRCDARDVPPDPALAKVVLDGGVATASEGSAPLLLVIDTFEAWAALEGWLRDEYLPLLSDETRVLIAGRQQPGARWRADPGWHDTMRHRALPPFTSDECAEYLERRNVVASAVSSTARASRGQPLLLALIADALDAEGDAEKALHDDRISDLLVEVADGLVPASSRPEERRALYASALVRHTSAGFLRDVLRVDDTRAAELLRWLEELSFTQRDEAGVFPHDVVRDALRERLKRRDAALRFELLDAALPWYLDRLEDAVEVDPRLMADIWFVLTSLMPRPLEQTALETDPSYADRPRTDELPLLRGMVERHEGAGRAALFDFWCGEPGATVHVARNAEGVATGFFLVLQMADVSDSALEADPVFARFWQARTTLARPMGDADDVYCIRMCLDAERHLDPSPAAGLWAIETTRAFAADPRIAWAAVVLPEEPYWLENCRQFGHAILEGGGHDVGAQRMMVSVHDFSEETAAEWLRAAYQRYRREGAGAGIPPADVDPAAVRSTLRNLHRPDRLAGSPLLHYLAGPDREAELRRMVEEECEALRGGEKNELLYRVLDRTYLRPASDQRAAAEASGLTWDQYRRRLTEAVKLLTARLARRLR